MLELWLSSQNKRKSPPAWWLSISGPSKGWLVQDGSAPIPKARLDVINPMIEKQEAKGLVPMIIKSGEIIWVHPNIVKDEQWESSKPKLKGKSCNIIYLATYDVAMIIPSLSDSEEEKLALVGSPLPLSQWALGLEKSTCDSTARSLMRHSSQRHR